MNGKKYLQLLNYRKSLYKENFMRGQTLFPVVVRCLRFVVLSQQNCFEKSIYGRLPFGKPTVKLVLVQLSENQYRVI